MRAFILLVCFLGATSAYQSDYVSLPGQTSLYSLDNTTFFTWEQAGTQCRADGAHLAVIDSVEEAQAIVQLLSTKGIDHFLTWTGFHDLFVEGQYITVLDQPITFNSWYPGYPYESSEVNCGGFLTLNEAATGVNNWGIVIYTCTALRTFICEKPAQ